MGIDIQNVSHWYPKKDPPPENPNFKNEILKWAKPHEILRVSFVASYEDGKRIPDGFKYGYSYLWEDVERHFDYEYSRYKVAESTCGCKRWVLDFHEIEIWTKKRIIFFSESDGELRLTWIRRNPPRLAIPFKTKGSFG